MQTKPADASRQWPVSPRLKSPPPSTTSTAPHNLSCTSSPKPQEDDAAAANTSSKRQPSQSRDVGQSPVKQDEEVSEENRSRPPQRIFARGNSTGGPGLATVEEAGTLVATETPPAISQVEESPEDTTPKPAKAAPSSGSDSGGSIIEDNKKTDSKDESKPQPPASNDKANEVVSKRSITSLSAARGKPGESSMKNMTVETETVSSIPQPSLGGGTINRSGANRKESGSGSIRTKPSDETIRPKKDKKKQTRKAVVPSGTASSKADVFEAKVASAVDDANTSDSEETFVYESNPPDSHPNRQHRYHSRTPSTTSMASQIDQYGGGKPRPGMREVSHGVTGKRSMKFTNNSNNPTNDNNGDEPNGSRASSRTARHYHTGRPARNGAHLSLLDQSPFTSQGAKSPRHLSNGNRHKSQNQNHRSNGTFKEAGDVYDYDFDAEGAADDERTPLVGTGRNRTRNGRRPNSASMRQMEYIEQRRRGWFSRYGVCIILIIFVLALVGCATTFVVGISKSVKDIQLREIQNVLASEQEIMLDLDVEAINPNLVSITMDEMDVNIFAKSRFVGGDGFWRDHGPHPEPLPRNPDNKRRAIMARSVRGLRTAASTDGSSSISSSSSSSKSLLNSTGIDRGTDPDPDPAGDPQTMLLGRIFHLDQPLTFEPSPWRHDLSHSIGQVRLGKPGNRTEEGGSIRWERVLQHQFELIVRGVVKYQLPLGSSSHSASISSSIKVDPDQDNAGGGEGDGDDEKNPGNGSPDDSDDDSVHIN